MVIAVGGDNMNTKNNAEQQKIGLAGLPRSWAVAVQLVGTFGLAVFLVLYYVLVMQPREAAKYEQLRTSIDRLTKVVEEEQGLVTKAQADKLEELFILAVAPQVADLIIEQLTVETSIQEFQAKLEDAIIVQTDLLSGLTREDGGSISEMLTHKIRNSDIAGNLAEQVVERWTGANRKEIVADCEDALRFAVRRARMAK